MSEGRITARACNFTMIGNTAINDPDIDLRALGLYVRMYQKALIPGFTLYKNVIQKESGLGRDAFQKIWNTLISKGYIKKNRKTGSNGRFYYEYELLSEPEQEETKTDSEEEPEADLKEEPAAVGLKLPERLHTMNHGNKLPNQEESPAAVSQKERVAPAQQGKKSTVHGFSVSGENVVSPCTEKPCTGKPYTGEPYHGKSGHYNNTIYNNTRLNNTILSSSSTKYSYSKADEEELKAVPEAVRKDQAYNKTAVLSVIEESLEYKPNQKDLKQILKKAAARYKRKDISSGDIQKPFAYFLEILANVSRPKTGDELKAEIKPNRAHNFKQRDYNYDELEKQLLAVQW